MKIHYRDDGYTPTLEDPTVDNVPSRRSVEPALPGWFAGVMKHVRGAFEAIARQSKPGRLAVEAAEASAIHDLRTVAAAEQAFGIMLNGDRYAPPEVLADPKMFAPVKMPPLLPAYFTQPVRMGYTFEFTGQALLASFGAFEWINPNYGSFVYSARPVGSEPAGRRSFAVYSDGNVFATTEDRMPTRNDTPLGTR